MQLKTNNLQKVIKLLTEKSPPVDRTQRIATISYLHIIYLHPFYVFEHICFAWDALNLSESHAQGQLLKLGSLIHL